MQLNFHLPFKSLCIQTKQLNLINASLQMLLLKKKKKPNKTKAIIILLEDFWSPQIGIYK